LAQIVITSATPAPEIDPASAAGGLALLVGGLLVLRGRKRHIVAG
jgi:LPXTG-motif cell wall-anchored protein